VDVEKPKLPEEPDASPHPPEAASKGERKVFWKGEWIPAKIWDMESLKAGNLLKGLAILESPATTFLIPPGASAGMDANRLFHLTFNRG
jgi:acetone carboxylase beta subunit